MANQVSTMGLRRGAGLLACAQLLRNGSAPARRPAPLGRNYAGREGGGGRWRRTSSANRVTAAILLAGAAAANRTGACTDAIAGPTTQPAPDPLTAGHPSSQQDGAANVRPVIGCDLALRQQLSACSPQQEQSENALAASGASDAHERSSARHAETNPRIKRRTSSRPLIVSRSLYHAFRGFICTRVAPPGSDTMPKPRAMSPLFDRLQTRRGRYGRRLPRTDTNSAATSPTPTLTTATARLALKSMSRHFPEPAASSVSLPKAAPTPRGRATNPTQRDRQLARRDQTQGTMSAPHSARISTTATE
jgi:hypothetical protein